MEFTITLPLGETANIKFWSSRNGVSDLRISQIRIKGTNSWQEAAHRNNIAFNNVH